MSGGRVSCLVYICVARKLVCCAFARLLFFPNVPFTCTYTCAHYFQATNCISSLS